jgi:hypothetical protein
MEYKKATEGVNTNESEYKYSICIYGYIRLELVTLCNYYMLIKQLILNATLKLLIRSGHTQMTFECK